MRNNFEPNMAGLASAPTKNNRECMWRMVTQNFFGSDGSKSRYFSRMGLQEEE